MLLMQELFLMPCISVSFLLQNVSRLPSALRTFPDFRQALASFLSFTLSSLTFHLYARFVFRSLRQLQTLSFVSLQFFELEVKLLFDAKKRDPFGSYLPVSVLLLRNVSQLPSALRTFPDFRQALASFLSFTLSSLTYHS